MDRLQLIDMVARTRRAADECERLRTVQAQQIRTLRAIGESTAQLESILIELEAECDRHMAEMERLLDELDRISADS
jgi:hypothetical protein